MLPCSCGRGGARRSCGARAAMQSARVAGRKKTAGAREAPARRWCCGAGLTRSRSQHTAQVKSSSLRPCPCRRLAALPPSAGSARARLGAALATAAPRGAGTAAAAAAGEAAFARRQAVSGAAPASSWLLWRLLLLVLALGGIMAWGVPAPGVVCCSRHSAYITCDTTMWCRSERWAITGGVETAAPMYV